MRLILSFSLAAAVLFPAGAGVQDTLADDARVAVVTDRQGTATVRPVGRQRWTPIGPRTLLMPGDQVRTSVRGANAVEMRLHGGGGLVLGPGSLIEIPERGAVTLYRGEIEVKGKVQVRGPGDFARKTSGTLILRSDGQSTEVLDQEPRWLSGYRSSTTDEWMGSLITQVDGRNVPLSVGYHNVTVDIRDQIARTTVEQSFVNSTNGTLEGVFYFPLPADASIGGFGMWIGGELVEADIVEKQRARAIYEDILRRRKDPGLLEWSGGNLFKARVFPIFPHSEKRIQIRYTQVLPMEGATMRYRYGLRSELLRSRPLRQLELKVNISSARPIRAVNSSSHAVRVRNTNHAASAEFEAEEFTPQRDFELTVELEPTAALTAVPHRRGEDGYLMLLLSPEGSPGKWQRELVPENGPLKVLLIADTSASMDRPARAAQSAFIGAFLSLLGPKDKFQLMTCDVETRWFMRMPAPVTEERASQALDFLERRRSLGWSDLDKAFAAAERVSADTLVIYVGDGIGTTGDADPVALAQRLRRLDTDATFHTVSTSSTYEKVVLEALASVGGGSVRAMNDDPARTAYRLLTEVAQPVVKDLKVEFEGLRTARVYPERLPNVAAGTQQVVLGRFLPTGNNQDGRIVVTGTLDGKPVRYTAQLRIREDEEGNSFVPRLWARRHIDALLEEGRSKAIQEEIVSFSEEFGIMTPYTSFLVLENDADRERYGVARRVKMRDGERFFAEGRDNAAEELRAQQMKVARSWRLNLRLRMLREIATLGKHLHQVAVGWNEYNNGFQHGAYSQLRKSAASGPSYYFGDRVAGKAGAFNRAEDESELDNIGADREGQELPVDSQADPDLAMDMPATEAMAPSPVLSLEMAEEKMVMGQSYAGQSAQLRFNMAAGNKEGFRDYRARGYIGGGLGYLPQFSSYRFPHLPPAPVPLAEFAEPEWPADVLTLLRSIDRRPALKSMTGAVSLRLTGGSIHALRGHWLREDATEGILRPDGWFVRSLPQDGEPMDQWLWAGKRGVLALGVRLGRQRDAVPLDAGAWPFPLRDSSLQDLVRTYSAYDARLDSSTRDGLATIVLTAPGTQGYRVHLVIDRQKRCLVEQRTETNGRVQGGLRLGDFAEAAGMWWATSMEAVDNQGRTVARYSLEVEEQSGTASANALHGVVSAHGDVLFLGVTDPDLDTAKQAIHESKAGFADYFRVALHFAATGQWDRVWENWQHAEESVAVKPGSHWLRATLLSQSRKAEELKALLVALAAGVAEREGPAVGFLAQNCVMLAGSVYQANEMLVLLDTLRPAFEGSTERRRVAWLQARAQWLAAAGQPADARDLYQQIAAARPFDIQAVMQYLNTLRQSGDQRGAVQVAAQAMETQQWLDQEAERIYERWTQFLWELRDLRSMTPVLEAWTARAPMQETAWQRWLSMLLFLDRENEADAWVAARLGGEIPGNTNLAGRAALGAAIQYALGRGWNFWAQRIEEKWHQPLADLALRLVRAEGQAWYLASRVMSDGRFTRTDAGNAMREKLLADLTDVAIAAMPVDRLGRYLGWIPWSRTQVDQQTWRRVVDRLWERWSGAEKQERLALAGHVLQLLDAHGETEEAMNFLRARLAKASDDMKSQVANLLVNRLVTAKWSEALEDEILGLIPTLQPLTATDDQRRNIAASSVRFIADELERMRYEHLIGPAAEREKLTRQALRLKTTESRRGARRDLAARFAVQRETSALTRPWFELERLSLLAQVGEDSKSVNGEVRELLFSAGPDSIAIEQVMRERCAYIVAYLATRPRAEGAVTDGAVALLRDRITAETTAASARQIDWQYHLFRLLIALDRPQELAQELSAWIVPAEVESRWRVAYGYLLAETGKLREAVDAFEAVARQDELGAAEYTAMADWYLVLDEPQRRSAALLGRYKVSSEHELSNLLGQELNRIARRGDGIPPELNPETMRILEALLTKASSPSNYIWQVQQLYRTVKDFRILESLADGVIGHTAQGVYPFLEQIGSVISQVHEEATCDSLVERIAALAVNREGVDRRALYLIRALVERRAAEVLNQAGPHGARGLEALRSAFRGTWLPGERRLMASFLASMGNIPQAPLAAEQIRQLTALYHDEKPGTFDSVNIALFLFRTHWAYGEADRALDGLSTALSEFRAAQGDIMPSQANGIVQTLISWYESRQRYRLAEAWLRRELAAEQDGSQRGWLTHHLFQVYVHCLSNRGAVALGRGADLYRAAREEMEQWMFTGGADQILATVQSYCQLHYNAVHVAGVGNANTDLERFSRQTLPELLTALPGNVQSVVGTVANMLESLSGPRVALAFLIERLEAEPSWYSRVNQGGWRHFAYNLARWRSAAGALGSLEPRLLRIVLAELERDLLSMQQHNRVIYQVNNSYFWRQKADQFAAVAMRVIDANLGSPSRILYAAEYLWHGLSLRARAIDTLLAAEERGKLREDGRYRVVTWLHEVRRYGDSLALLESLTSERPDRLDYRVLKIRALHETDQDPAAITYLDETEERFKSHDLWNEQTIATLANISLTCSFHERSVTYYEEVIPLHQRTQPNRGVGNGTLSHYYGQIARGYVALGNPDKAVDAASAAVVSWGRTHYNRTSALSSLRSVIEKIRDLDAYVARRDKVIEETGLDAPVLRKSIGQVYLAKRQPVKAIPQLLAAVELQPNDAETHRALLSAYDALGQPRQACTALLRAIEATPMNLELYSDLGARLALLRDMEQAERAWTSLVEVQPNEAESHRRLAHHRDDQRRYGDAVTQWAQVVRVRTDEPDGWLALAQAQVRAGDRKAAVKTLEQVIDNKWDQRFGDVKKRALRLLAPLSKPPR